MRLRVAFRTFGCKLNQLETESLADAFARAGAEIVGAEGAAAGTGTAEAVDLVILNTCTVTSKAEQKARRVLRQDLAGHPRSAAIVTGCYAQVEVAAVAALHERVLVVGGDGKDALLGLPGWLADNWDGHGDILDALREWKSAGGGAAAPSAAALGRFAFEPSAFAFHSRPSLKVQDGCDNGCAYCRVRIARGSSVSLDPETVLERARALEAQGKAEIVLTGVNLSQYRHSGLDFALLLERLVAGTESVAFRLSSYEPDRVDEAFLEAFAHPRVRPHVHLAVQSGADPVLAAMGRRYRRDRVIGAVRALRAAKGDPFIGADLIVGFPGETEADADATLALAQECDFAWIHAFRFSPRPGTKAASMPGHVPERIAGVRARALAERAHHGKETYASRWEGAEVRAVLEGHGGADDEDERLLVEAGTAVPVYATSENYLKLRLREVPESLRAGQAVVCRIDPQRSTEGEFDRYALYLHYVQ
jgi:threonylcarbamoyladenosine tRNA methylthiotransferase MtaB